MRLFDECDYDLFIIARALFVDHYKAGYGSDV